MKSLPSGWEELELRELLELDQSGVWGDKGCEDDYPVLRSTNIHEGRLILKDVAFRKNIENVDKYILNNGDILVTKSSGSKHLVGKVCIFNQPKYGIKYLFSNFIQRLRVKKNRVLSKFLFYFLNSFEGKINLTRMNETTSGLRNLNMKLYNKQKIKVPPLNVQKQIIAILERAEKLKEKRLLANETTNQILQSVFLEMLKKNKFSREEIEKHVIKTEMIDPRKKPNEYFKYVDIAGVDNKNGEVSKIKTVQGKDAPSRARKVIKENDVIVSTVRPNLNATALIPEKLNNQICSTGFCVLRCKNSLNPRYLHAFTRKREFIDILSSKVRGASYPAVTDKGVLEIKIPIPTIEVQNKFAKIAEKVRSIKERQEKSAEDTNRLFDSLIQKAFAGELVK